MSFEVTAENYSRFMGRWADPLAIAFADFVDVQPGDRVLDVGCGPGTLTAVLVDRLGSGSVSAIDPSESFVRATAARFPDVSTTSGAAEDLPYPDDAFDLALAQLVVHFMSDPVAGLREMGRVTRPGGVVAACVWDHAGGQGPLSPFWDAVAELDPDAPGEAQLPGTTQGHLVQLASQAGLTAPSGGALTVAVRCDTVEDWWGPFTLGVGPSGDYVAGLSEERRARLQELCTQRLPKAPFEIQATAWTMRARA
ncbi:class I SAM-dependent methyltransferase [Nocardioides sp.]|uniref:class I SAM-dependent methyltransferase n=1 Tax=Nocardioides sp. TaxID=35761 RepID=UPI003D0AD221